MTEISDYFQYRMRLGITSLKKWIFCLSCTRLSLSLDKIGCGSEMQIKKFLFAIALAFHYLCTVETVLRLNRERSEILRQSRCCKFYLSSTAFATEARLREGAVVGNESEDLPFRYCQTSITPCADRFQL